MLRNREAFVDPGFSDLSVRQQCELLQIARSSYYYQSCYNNDLNQDLANIIHELWL